MKYDIKNFGAKTDGTLCTEAIQAAIDAAFLAGGGENDETLMCHKVTQKTTDSRHNSVMIDA